AGVAGVERLGWPLGPTVEEAARAVTGPEPRPPPSCETTSNAAQSAPKQPCRDMTLSPAQMPLTAEVSRGVRKRRGSARGLSIRPFVAWLDGTAAWRDG